MNQVIEDALRMAIKVGCPAYLLPSSRRYQTDHTQISYFSLGTFEFLVHQSSGEYCFLEINPRLQVEHTITEAISFTDIVRIQLLCAQGAAAAETGVPLANVHNVSPPLNRHSIQLRVTAEDPSNQWSLSIGRITSFRLPFGNGVRVDTALVNDQDNIVGSAFDSLLAKVIVTASSWEATVQKALRALRDTRISGVKTNIEVLHAIVSHPDFLSGQCDTRWLESKQKELLELAQQISQSRMSRTVMVHAPEGSDVMTGFGKANMTLRKGDAWSLSLKSTGEHTSAMPDEAAHSFQLKLTSISQNRFPDFLKAQTVLKTLSTGQEDSYLLEMAATSAAATSVPGQGSQRRKGDYSDPSHIVIPFSGEIIDFMVEEGDAIKEDDVICVVRQMKMELEVRSAGGGIVTWAFDGNVGDQVMEGTLAAIVQMDVAKAKL